MLNGCRTGEAKIIGKGRELQAVRKDGTLIDIFLRVIELRLEDERLFIGTIQDISERKKTQIAIRDAVKRLARSMGEILATTSKQSKGTSEQATAVAETATTVEELRQVAEQADERLDPGPLKQGAAGIVRSVFAAHGSWE